MKKDVVTVSFSMSLEDLIRFMFEKKYTVYPIFEGNNSKFV
jgi:CBS domain-containing protein